MIALHPLKFLLEAFRFAPEHFLLPTLLRALLIPLGILGQLLLPPGQFFQLAHGLIDFFLFLLRGHLLAGFVLVFFRVEFEIEEADSLVVALPARYAITYRTLAQDLAIQG